MSRLEELINELCPDGVEYKKLADVCNFNRGTSLVSKNAKSGNIPVISGGQKPAFYHNEANRTGTTITVAGSGAYAGYVSIWYEPIFVCDAFSVEPKNADELDIKYLYHYLTNNQNKIYNKKTGAGIPHVHGKDIAKFSIPLPPLSIQNEIVHILDSFTLLTAELTAELTARQKQYAFYRDYLLDFSNEDVIKKIPDIDCSNVEYKRLGNIAIIERGKRVVRNDLSQEIGYPVYQNALKPLGYYTDKNRNANSVFIIGAGAAGEIGYSYVDYWAADDCFTFVCDDKLNQRYLYFLLMSKQAYLNNNVRKSSIPRLPRIALENMEIPVPPLSVQENIVKILDRFDKLNNDMSEGLPAEIEARKKQYEYYRDTLLSFDDKACSHIVKVERERELSRTKSIKWLKLGEIGKVRMCKRILKSQTNTKFGVPFYKIGTFGKKADAYVSNELFNEYKLKYSYPKKGDILISCSGTIGRTVVFNGKPAYFQDSNIVWLENDESVVLNTYLKYCYDRQPWRAESGGTIARLYNANIENAVIPVPPLEEQERIVSILDRFDKLCNDISEGLPAEIEARQKQYEYYRDKLLMFKRVEANEK